MGIKIKSINFETQDIFDRVDKKFFKIILQKRKTILVPHTITFQSNGKLLKTFDKIFLSDKKQKFLL